jgi:hypothetical protein
MKTSALSVLLLAAALAAGAVPTGVVYTEGEALVRFKAGTHRDAAIGDILNTGDGVRTGADGLVELDQSGVTLHIDPDTVFTLMEKEQKGKTTGVLSLVLGSVKFRYDRLTGQEPLIQTASCIAGVRGTELTVFAGVDGSALIVVEKGAVEVEAEGATVALAPEEAVEVRPGQPPGDKFTLRRDQVDYRTWNDEKLKALLENPEQAIGGVLDQLEAYIRDIEQYSGLFLEHRRKLDEERKALAEIIKKGSKEEAKAYDVERVAPLRMQSASLFLNLRFYTLAAQSLRRYVAARLYLFLKERQVQPQKDPIYPRFLSLFDKMLDRYEQKILPHLVEADI